MRASPRLARITLVAVAAIALLACGSTDALQAIIASPTSTPTAGPGAIEHPSPTAAGAPAASGGIAHEAAGPTEPVSAADTGAISGALSYPSDYIPALRIVAFDTRSGGYYALDTETGQQQYLLSGLPPSTYNVVAYVREAGTPALSAGYSQYILCGAEYGCEDHALVDVEVAAGQTVEGIDPGDWYAPDGTYPPDPSQ